MTRHGTQNVANPSANPSAPAASAPSSQNPSAAPAVSTDADPADAPQAETSPIARNLKGALQRILAARNAARSAESAPARRPLTPAELRPARRPRPAADLSSDLDADSEGTEAGDEVEAKRQSDWARHVEWTLRMMS